MINTLVILNIILGSYCILNFFDFNIRDKYSIVYFSLTFIHIVLIFLLINIGGI